MSQEFEYLVCQSQEGKITVVNGEFVGTYLGNQAAARERERTMDSCPEVSHFLNLVGATGWELVCGYHVVTPHGQFEKLILKRVKSSESGTPAQSGTSTDVRSKR